MLIISLRSYRFTRLKEELIWIFFNIDKFISQFTELIIGCPAKCHNFYETSLCLLEIVHHRTEIPITRHENHRIHFRSETNSIHSNTEIPVSFFGTIDEGLNRLLLDLKSTLMKRINKDFIGLLCCINCISYSSRELSSLEYEPENIFEIHTRMVEILRRIVEILDIDEDGHALFRISYNHSSYRKYKVKSKK